MLYMSLLSRLDGIKTVFNRLLHENPLFFVFFIAKHGSEDGSLHTALFCKYLNSSFFVDFF